MAKKALGIEFGSTRIKAVLTNERHEVLAQGSHTWENRYENGYWTYSLEDITSGLRDAYADLKRDAKDKLGEDLTTLDAIGISAMMHGYIALGKDDELLTPFRTWRNTTTGEAAAEISELFGVNIPQRWSIAHLYQAILNKETHVPDLAFLTTLSGYVHYLLTGEKVLGVGDASGMFPIDSETGNYDARMFSQFTDLIQEKNYLWTLHDILPKVLPAGEVAGTLTEAGAKLLDPSGDLKPGIPLAPPEGDAGTGMTATNAVLPGTGNVSAGTSIFGMLVLKQDLSRAYETIDMVTTPDGAPVAMVHCNNCTSELNAWAGLFSEVLKTFGAEVDTGTLYTKLFEASLDAAPNAGGVVADPLVSGEPVLGKDGGNMKLVHPLDAEWNLSNFMKAQLYSCVAALADGFRVFHEEGVSMDGITGHGGYFQTPGIGQQILADALNAPVTVMETAAEGGAWGMAVLAQYMVYRGSADAPLPDYLQHYVFRDAKSHTLTPNVEGVEGFADYLDSFLKIC